MSKFIRIESKGIIDPQAFVLLGASTKRDDDTKIGFFGSGLKYSIAYLLRHKINFKVFADYKEITFSTTPVGFRDNNFDVININGQATSMTTEMGIDWEAWFVLREIYCNAIDEGDSLISVVSQKKVVPIEDKTVFYIECNAEFDKIIADWDSYFSEERKDKVSFDLNLNKIFTGGDNLIVYRKGIRCYYAPDQKCSFNYDMSWIEINESRTIKSEWGFKWELLKHLQQCTDKTVITHLYNTINDTYERGLDWSSRTRFYSDAWLVCLNGKVLVPTENAGYWSDDIKEDPKKYILLPSPLIEGLKLRFIDAIKVIGDVDGISANGDIRFVQTLSKKQTAILNDARLFLASAEYPIKYEIKIVDFVSNKDRLGQAKDSTILLSTKLFERGRKELVECIIEEQEHLETGYADETRAFQSHFIKKYVTELENKTNTYL